MDEIAHRLSADQPIQRPFGAKIDGYSERRAEFSFHAEETEVQRPGYFDKQVHIAVRPGLVARMAGRTGAH